MTTQPEALRLADALQRHVIQNGLHGQAAAELRRLHEVNQELLEELKGASNYIDNLGGDSNLYRIAIAKATGESK